MALTYFQITGSISLGFCLLSFSMIAFRWSVTKRTIPWIVVYITLSDVLTTIGYLLGTPEDRSPQCSIQGYLTTTFPLCSFCWTALAGWKLYQSCHHPNPTNQIPISVHFLIWITCLAYGFLPLTTSRYGCETGTSSCWCYVTHDENTLWTALWYYSFYVLLWIFFLIYTLLCIYIWSYLSSTNQQKLFSSATLSRHVYKLGGYPLVIIICWLPISVLEILGWNQRVLIGMEEFAYVCLGLQGCFASIVYLLTNASHWKCYHSKNTHGRVFHSDTPPRSDPPKVHRIHSKSVIKVIYLPKDNSLELADCNP